jgi:NosR/NirI family transcriptional regulator, nitrous oxide reductase regulator
MRTALALVLATVAGLVVGAGQSAIDPKLQGQLKQLFPAAASFTPKGGNPPHFKALGGAPGVDKPPVLGFAFWTTELEPLERAYDGPIKMLVGLDATGILTGIVIVDHHEPYGYFSIDPPRFQAQFQGKDIRDPFRVGADVDAISRATVTITSATRAIKNSARRVAKQLIAPPPGPPR